MENIVEILVKSGADVNQQNIAGDTSLHFAVRSDLSTITNQLIRLGADINLKNEHGDTPLHHAIINKCNKKRIIEPLLSHGADYNIKNYNGHSPLHYAVKMKNEEIIDLLHSYINKELFLYACIGLKSHKVAINALIEIGKHLIESEKEIIAIINQSNE